MPAKQQTVTSKHTNKQTNQQRNEQTHLQAYSTNKLATKTTNLMQAR